MNRRAYVCTYGGKRHALEAKLRGVKTYLFLEILVFLWVVMADQILYVWMQVTS
jgi:hypothetical protein